MGGGAARAADRLPAAKAVTQTSGSRLRLVRGELALVGMIALRARGGPFDPTLGAVFATVVAGGLAVMAAPSRALPRSARLPLAQLYRLVAAWCRHRRALLCLSLAVLGFALASLWQCARAFSAIGAPLPAAGVLVYAGAKNLAFLVGLTPGPLGIVEGLGQSLDYSPAQALLVQALLRAVSLSVLLVAGPLSVQVVRRRLAAAGGTSVRDEEPG